MKRLFIPALATLFSLALVMLVQPVSASAATSTSDAQLQRSHASAKLLDELTALASRIYALGSTRYTSTFAGVRIIQKVRLDVSEVRHGSNAFNRAAARLNPGHLPSKITLVPHSYAQQSRASSWITSHLRTLSAEGIEPSFWSPNPSGDDVLVALRGATTGQYGELQSAVRSLERRRGLRLGLSKTLVVTTHNFMRVALAALNAQAPIPIISMSSHFVGQAHVSSGPLSDTRPFFGADKIWYTLGNSQYCTSNVTATTSSGAEEILTAAHCSDWDTGYSFYTCATYDSDGYCNYNFGKVTKLDDTLADYELIPTTGSGYLWDDNYTDGSVNWPVVGWDYTEAGDYLSTDAVSDGAKHNLLVDSAGGSNSCFTESGDGKSDVTVCDAVILSSSSSICAAGDSGGIIGIVDGGTGDTTVIGMINARSSSDGTYYCYGMQIGYILNANGLSLLTG